MDHLGNEDNVDMFIQKILTQPTLKAHQQSYCRFTNYGTVVETELPGFLEKSGYVDIEAVLTPGAPIIKMSTSQSCVICDALMLNYIFQKWPRDL